MTLLVADRLREEGNHDPHPLREGPRVERILSLDVMRGLALYGVLLANTVVWFNGLAFIPADGAPPESRADRVAGFMLDVFVHGKAMSLLSFLFGLGFAMQLQRAERAGRDVTAMYLRRLAAMFAIGVLHVVLLWWGDILRSYAIAGLLLLAFRRRRDRTLLVWAAALTLLPQLIPLHPSYSPLIARISPGPLDERAFEADLLAALRGPHYLHLLPVQTLHSIRFLIWVAVPSLTWTLGRFLMGFMVGRRELLEHPTRHLAVFRRVLAWALPVGLVGSLALPVLRLARGPHPSKGMLLRIAMELVSQVGCVGMTAASVAAVVLVLQRERRAARILASVAPAGQMPLTTYLAQSLIASFLFDGWGLGLIGRVGVAACIPLTAAIFGVQVVIAAAWMKRFRFGPAEWVWRALSYGTRPPMRRASRQPELTRPGGV